MSTAALQLAHLVHLNSLLPAPILELGPAPVDLPDDVRSVAIDHLLEAGLVDTGGTRLTPLAESLLGPLNAYSEAYWGMTLLHNQRQPVRFEVDDRWAEHLKETFVHADTPRVYFLCAYRDGVATFAVRNHDSVEITQSSVTADGFAAATGRLLLNLGDPQSQWRPLRTPVMSIPYDTLASAPPRRPEADGSAHEHGMHRRGTAQYIATLRSDRRELDSRSLAALSKLLSYDHVASTQVLYSRGPRQLTPDHGASIDYFHGQGVAVSHPRRVADGSYWKVIQSATVEAVGQALDVLAGLPGAAREPVGAGVVGHRAPEDIIRELGIDPDVLPPQLRDRS
nr:hypothetical protein [Rhodococcus sp. (in: high G+C Gram-positive bacteria)]